MIFSIANSSGKIIKLVDAVDQEKAEWQVQPNQYLFAQYINPDTHYVINPGIDNIITSRQPLSSVATWNKVTFTANGSDSADLSGLPIPSNYRITVPVGAVVVAPGVASSGALIIKSNYPGAYLVEIDSFPYLLYQQTITAV